MFRASDEGKESTSGKSSAFWESLFLQEEVSASPPNLWGHLPKNDKLLPNSCSDYTYMPPMTGVTVDEGSLWPIAPAPLSPRSESKSSTGTMGGWLALPLSCTATAARDRAGVDEATAFPNTPDAKNRLFRGVMVDGRVSEWE